MKITLQLKTKRNVLK